jgi:uncharacterized protein YrrD
MLQQGLAFKGFSIEASDGKIGIVSDFLFDDSTWKLRWLVVDTGTWFENCKLLLHPSAIDRADVSAKALLVKLTRDQVGKSPKIATDEPVSLQMEYRLYGYYGIDPMWGGYYYGSTATDQPGAASGPRTAVPNDAVPEDAVNGPHAKGDPHLRSLADVTGYNIEATDGKIGHIDSFLIDDESWDVRYLVADTRNWWFGRHVLLSPASVQRIGWDEHTVSLNLTCYKIKSSPPWNATGLLDRAYEALLQAHYDWPAGYPPSSHAATGTAPIAAPIREDALS